MPRDCRKSHCQGKRYKAKGKFINAARPGYRHDRMFNKLFGDSFLVYKAMTVFQVVIVCTQLFLMHNAQWDRLVALCLEQFHGYWNLFRIVRNWFTGENFQILGLLRSAIWRQEMPYYNFSKTCLFRIDAKESRSIHDHSKAMRICWKRILQNWTRMSHNILVIH